MTPPLTLLTAAYPAFRPEWGVPVQTSNGAPKYPLRYKLDHAAHLLYPKWADARAKISMSEFTDRYSAMLTKYGERRIRAQLEQIARHAGNDTLVLLCFEKSRTACHRSAFAQWWQETTGEEVREAGGPPPPPKPEPSIFDNQQTLF